MSLQIYVKDQFGSRRGLMRSAIAEAKYMLGAYKKCKQVEPQNINRLIFICSGNICRSPFGEAVAKSYGVAAESFGLDTRGDDPADPRAIAYALARDIDLSQHKTRKIEAYEPKSGDLLIGMEPAHYQKLRLLYGDSVAITLAGLWLSKPITYLHDPYNTNPKFFDKCLSLVALSAAQIAEQMTAAKKGS